MRPREWSEEEEGICNRGSFAIAGTRVSCSRGSLRTTPIAPTSLVLALPRGGVPVAYEVARALDAPLDVFLVRKLGVPGHEELAMGAVATGGVRVLNDTIVAGLGIPDYLIDAVAAQGAGGAGAARAPLPRRPAAPRRPRPHRDPRG